MSAEYERWCRYCRISWDVQFADDDSILNNSATHCPDCDSDDAMLMSDARKQVRDLDCDADYEYERRREVA